MKRLVTYIFPVYNNAPSLNALYTEMRTVTGSIAKKYEYEFIFVNDGSQDNSLEVLTKLAKKDKHVIVLNLSRNFGHQAAVSAGMDRSKGDAVIIMDADLQDPPAVCPLLIKKWEEGYQVVYAQQRSRQDSAFKRFTANLYYRVISSLSPITIPRNVADFRLADRRVVNIVCQMKEYHRYLRGMFSFAGFRQAAVPFDRQARHAGKSQYTLKKQIKLAKDGIFGFSDAPLRLVTRLGFFVSLFSVLGILYAVILKLFFTYITVPGWTMIVVSIFFMGGVQLVMLGVIGEYIGRIYNEVRNRPNYIIAEELKAEE